MTIGGSGLESTTKVLFNDVPAQFTIISDTLITAVVPLTAAPGQIRVFTAGGDVASPTPFNLTSVAPPAITPLNDPGFALPLQSDESPDAAVAGSKIEINSPSTGSVYEVDFALPYSAPNSGTPADFTFATDGNLLVTVPELAPGQYEVRVFSASSTVDGNYPPDVLLNTYWDTSFSKWTNILGTTFQYGELIDVLANARPHVTSITNNDGGTTFERGTPIAIRGSGFTGVNDIRLYTDFANDKTKFIDIVNSPSGSGLAPLFTVVSDNAIVLQIPIQELPGTAGSAKGNPIVVQVFTPNGVPNDPTDDLASQELDSRAQFVLSPTPTLTFDDSAVNGQFYGSTITLTATSGDFYGVSQLFADAAEAYSGAGLGQAVAPQPFPISAPSPFNPDPAVNTFFQNFAIVPGTGGTVVQVVIPVGFAKIPDAMPPTLPPGSPPVPPLSPAAQVVFSAVSNAGTVPATPIPPIPVGPILELQPAVNRPDPDTIAFLGVNASGNFNSVYTVFTNEDPISTGAITIGNVGTISRDDVQATQLAPGLVELDFRLVVARDPFDPRMTDAVPNGNILVSTPDDNSSTTVPVNKPQTFPQIFLFSTSKAPPQDNRMIANRIFENGLTIQHDPTTGAMTGVILKDQATAATDGDLGIDFVTSDPNAAVGFPFFFGYARTDQGPPNAPPPGDQGRGGINDGLVNSFIEPSGISALPTDPTFNSTALPNGANFQLPISVGGTQGTGGNTFNNTQFGRYFGPNLLENFPLLQVVQSSVDRTEFSTALLGKPYRSYRIDYYYNPGVDNSLDDATLDPFLSSQAPTFTGARFDDQDPTARATTNIGAGQIYLGSKIITTDGEGNGSVSFNVYRRLPTDPNDPNSVPPLQPGDFNMPDNLPLQPGQVDPVTGNITFRAGVVTSTATDLTAPGPLGPNLTQGPDGTSRFSFFKRVDTPTGSIGGRVLNDVNHNGVVDSNDAGLANATVDIYVQKDDGTYFSTPTQRIVTGDDGSFTFGNPGTGGGYGLPNGTHKLVLTLPTGGTTTYYFENPIDGKQNITIIGGATLSNQDFLVTTVPNNTPPTISTIPSQTVAQGATVNQNFTVGDAETPAAQLTVSAKSSNTVFIPLGNITFGGSGANRTITVTTPAGTSGSSTITVTVTDAGGLTASTTFTIIAGSTGNNTPPTISGISNQTVTPGGNTGALTFTVGDQETAPGNLIVQAFTTNPALVPVGNIVLGGSGANRTVTVTTLPGVIGSTTVTLVVTDDGGLTSQTSFIVTVPPPPGTAPHLLAVGSDAGRTAQVNVYDPNGTFRYTLTPYGDSFTGGVRVATGDVTGDGNADIIVAPGPGIGGLVKIYDGVTGNFITQYLPYGDAFRGGVYVTTGDVDADGIQDIITGRGRCQRRRPCRHRHRHRRRRRAPRPRHRRHQALQHARRRNHLRLLRLRQSLPRRRLRHRRRRQRRRQGGDHHRHRLRRRAGRQDLHAGRPGRPLSDRRRSSPAAGEQVLLRLRSVLQRRRASGCDRRQQRRHPGHRHRPRRRRRTGRPRHQLRHAPGHLPHPSLRIQLQGRRLRGREGVVFTTRGASRGTRKVRAVSKLPGPFFVNRISHDFKACKVTGPFFRDAHAAPPSRDAQVQNPPTATDPARRPVDPSPLQSGVAVLRAGQGRLR
jgi:hypothetical protein